MMAYNTRYLFRPPLLRDVSFSARKAICEGYLAIEITGWLAASIASAGEQSIIYLSASYHHCSGQIDILYRSRFDTFVLATPTVVPPAALASKPHRPTANTCCFRVEKETDRAV